MNTVVNQFLECLICDSRDIQPLERYKKDHLVKCAACEFVFSSRIPSEAELQAEYATTYTRSDEISLITLSRYPGILDHFETYRSTNNIIDVGAGNGHFLKAARERGWNTYGTEFDERAVKICTDKGIHMHSGKLNPSNYEPEKFDIITSFEVIEHINNPKEELSNFYRILRPGGIVHLTTPNVGSISKAFLKEKWTIFNYPEHLCYYSPKTIKMIFKRLGFTKRYIHTTGINFDRIVASAGVKSGWTGGLDNEAIRASSETGFWMKGMKQLVNRTLNMFRIGDKIKAEFVKEVSLHDGITQPLTHTRT